MNRPDKNRFIRHDDYIETLYPPDPILEHVRRSLHLNAIHDISVTAGCGRLLTLLVRIAGARTALEIGALGGYSGICIARGLPDSGRLCSLELNPDYAALARSNLQLAGLDHKVEFRTGEAMKHLQQLKQEGARFDFLFIDADKGNYPGYLERVIELSNPGAVIVGDNLFLGGKITSEASQGNSVSQMRRFNQLAATHPRLQTAILPGYDGIAIMRVLE